MREISLPGVAKAILSDTVGFVSDLPTQLVAAFRATLEEVISADIIVHVRDISHPDSEKQKHDVIEILKSLGLQSLSQLDEPDKGDQSWSSFDDNENIDEDEDKQTPIIEVWNKSDLLDEGDYTELSQKTIDDKLFALISAHNGNGIEELQDKLSQLILRNNKVKNISVSAANGALLAWLHRNADIIEQRHNEDMIDLEISLNEQQWGQYLKQVETS